MSRAPSLAGTFGCFGWPDVMETKLVMSYASKDRATITRAVAAGALVAAGRRGRKLIFRKSDVDRWLLGEPTTSGVPAADSTGPSHRASHGSTTALDRLKAIARGAR